MIWGFWKHFCTQICPWVISILSDSIMIYQTPNTSSVQGNYYSDFLHLAPYDKTQHTNLFHALCESIWNSVLSLIQSSQVPSKCKHWFRYCSFSPLGIKSPIKLLNLYLSLFKFSRNFKWCISFTSAFHQFLKPCRSSSQTSTNSFLQHVPQSVLWKSVIIFIVQLLEGTFYILENS
jgi:hypothetical protein